MTVVLWTLYRRASVSIESPGRYWPTRCLISVRDGQRCAGFESRPVSSDRAQSAAAGRNPDGREPRF